MPARDNLNAAMADDVATAHEQVRAYLLCGATIVGILVGALGFWAATTELSGAVMASGVVVVDTSVKKVQHPTGGVVGSILVKDGDTVAGGDLLLRLDDTVARANLQLVTTQLDEIEVRKARLKAELMGAAELTFPEPILRRRSEPRIDEIVRTEGALFQSRMDGRNGLKAQLRERVEQLHQQIAGLAAQRNAKTRELELSNTELGGLEMLERTSLVSVTKITAARRLVAQIESELAQTIASASEVRGKIAEIDLQILQIDQDLRSEVAKDLREQQARAAELTERKIAAEDQLGRMDIRAPQAGVVHQLAVHTVGGVVSAGEPILLVVPNADRLVIEAKIAGQDIDQVKVGLPAQIRFTAFSQRTTPEVRAVVTLVSADLLHEGQNGAGAQVAAPLGGVSYFVARLALSDGGVEKLNGMTLIPGMPAEVHIATGTRTALSYLAKPLVDQFARAFRER